MAILVGLLGLGRGIECLYVFYQNSRGDVAIVKTPLSVLAHLSPRGGLAEIV